MLLLLILSFFILALMGVPIAFAIGLSSLFTILFNDMISPTLMISRLFSGLDSFTIMAIPFYILAGSLMNASGLTDNLVTLSKALVGHIRGGTSHVNVLASMFFAGISGSAGADCSAIGSILIPSMIKEGYSKEYAAAITASSSTLGPIIPPSLLMIIYGSLAGVSVGSLFLGGVIPGIIVGLGQMVLGYFVCLKNGFGLSTSNFDFLYLLKSIFKALPALVIPVIILGGIVFGIFTATEAGVIAVVYAFCIGLLTRSFTISKLKTVFIDSAKMTGMIMLIIGMANIFAGLMARAQFNYLLADFINHLNLSANMTLVMFIVIIFILGMFMDGIAILMILAPTFSDIGIRLGIDPILQGVLVVMAVLVGGLTPPLSIYVFITSTIANVELAKVIRTNMPFLIFLILVIFFFIAFPQLVAFLPNLSF